MENLETRKIEEITKYIKFFLTASLPPNIGEHTQFNWICIFWDLFHVTHCISQLSLGYYI